MYFTDGPLRVYEQEMRHPPYEKRPGGGSYTFLSDPAPPPLSSHTQATKLSYRQLVSDCFHDLERSPLRRRIEALTAGAAGYSGSCRPGYRFWQQICTRYPGLCQPPASCTPSQPEAPEQPSQPEEPDAPDTPSEPDTPAQPDDVASISAYEQEVVTLVNAERAKYGFSALTLDATL